MAISACGEAGSKAIKAAAKAIAEEEAQNTQPQPTQPVQPAQPTQPTYTLNPEPVQVQAPPTFPQDNQPNQAHIPVESLPPKPVPPTPQIAERVVRYRATVLTQYGGKVIVRQSPSKNGRKLGFLYDSEEVFVIGETNKCETINGLYGCWVKVVDSLGLSGYSFGAYLTY